MTLGSKDVPLDAPLNVPKDSKVEPTGDRASTAGVAPTESLITKNSAVIEAPAEDDNPHLYMPFHEWLESIDDSLFMLQYCEKIVSNFDSLKQIHDIYFHDGHIDAQFYKAAGITKLGHKRIIEKWFRENCG